MLFTTVFASAALPVLAMASPIINNIKRAGAPAINPIPANCTVINPLPHSANVSTCGNATISGYEPSAAAHGNQIYSFYLSQPDFQTPEKRWTTCIDQCNGLSGCKSAFMAYNAPTPKGYYGTEGGVPSIGCMMYNVTLTPNDFVSAPSGQYVNATAGNIYCPA